MEGKFGSLTIIRKTNERKHGFIVYEVQCDCGEIEYRISTGIRANSKCKKCRQKSIVKSVKTHGRYAVNKRLATICKNAYIRCTDKNNPSYKDYGGRGITFDFESIEDMFEWSLENGYEDNLTIDRIDNDKGYSPDNCRWVDVLTQANNKRDTLELDGITGINNIANYLGVTRGQLNNLIYKQNKNMNEIKRMYLDGSLSLSINEKQSLSQRKRQCNQTFSKEQVIEIINNINNGSSINKEAIRTGKAHLTVKRAIERFNDGIYE